MTRTKTSSKKGKLLSLILFGVGLVVIAYYGEWWPAIMLVCGVPLALYQYLQGRHYDTGITLFVFVGAFITVQFNIAWQIVLPTLFVIGGIYIFFREFIEIRSEAEQEEDLNDEISENDKKK